MGKYYVIVDGENQTTMYVETGLETARAAARQEIEHGALFVEIKDMEDNTIETFDGRG